MNENSRLAAHVERLRTIPGLGRDVTALTIIVVVGLVTASVLKSQLGGTLPWSDETVVKAEFQQVPGLNPSSQNGVTIAGVKVGSVTETEATDHGTAIVTMTLEGNHEVHRDARAVLRPKNALNEMQIELNPGTEGAAVLDDDGVIPLENTERPIQADEVLEGLDERSQLALTDLLVESDVALARAPQNLPEGLDASSDALGTLKPVVTELRTRRLRIAKLVTALADISTAVGESDKRAVRLADATSRTLETLASSDEQLRQSLRQMPGLSRELRSALASTQKLTDQLDPTLDGLDAASQELPGALRRLRSTVGNLDKTLDATKPTLDQAVPVIADLRPLVNDVRTAVAPFVGVTNRLDGDTRTVMTYQDDIAAFVYNTSSVFGAGDVNGSIIRGHLMIPLPAGGVLPNSVTQGRGEGR